MDGRRVDRLGGRSGKGEVGGLESAGRAWDVVGLDGVVEGGLDRGGWSLHISTRACPFATSHPIALKLHVLIHVSSFVGCQDHNLCKLLSCMCNTDVASNA